MLNQNNEIDTNHREKRTWLRTVGVIVLITGITLLVVGMVDFFSAAGDPFGGGPKMFWVNFIALPLIFAGAAMASAGYMGAVARYQAGEMAPVAKDALNYIADETKDSVRTIARSIKEGLAENHTGTVSCGSCGKDNPAGSSFCNSCGASIKPLGCSSCGMKNPPGSRFCNACGRELND